MNSKRWQAHITLSRTSRATSSELLTVVVLASNHHSPSRHPHSWEAQQAPPKLEVDCTSPLEVVDANRLYRRYHP